MGLVDWKSYRKQQLDAQDLIVRETTSGELEIIGLEGSYEVEVNETDDVCLECDQYWFDCVCEEEDE